MIVNTEKASIGGRLARNKLGIAEREIGETFAYSWTMQDIANLLVSEDFFWGVFCTIGVFVFFNERSKSRTKEEERRHRAAVERGEIPR